MTDTDRALTPRRVTAIGLLSMATAMGIGRFAFTPLLPLMQEAEGLSLSDGVWLATINYLGYLLGAMAGFVRPPRPGAATRWGLVSVAASTLGMAVASTMPVWLVLRFVAGVASAFVLIGVSGWALGHLVSMRRAALGGWVFGGVGIGIAAAGAVAFVVGTSTGDPVPGWAALGVVGALIAAWTWKPLTGELAIPHRSGGAARPLDRSAWVLVVCYGAFGFGYIVPATFLPAVARGLVNDPSVFGWIWPAFGIAAALSTIVVSTFLSAAAPRLVCGVSMLVTAVGTAAPLVSMSIPGLVFSAICVGGTFVVVTLAGIQEARRIAPDAAARLVAGMTAAFAFGQLAGPLLAHAGASAVEAMRVPSMVATVLLVAGALGLLWGPAGSDPR